MSNFLTGVKDIDLKILDELDDRSLIQTCLVNKKAAYLCSDEGFWRRRYYQKYGQEAASYKNASRSWKEYYLLTLHYDEKYYPNVGLERVAAKGYLDLVKFFILKGAKGEYVWSRAMANAAENDYRDVTDYLLANQRPLPIDEPIHFEVVAEGAAKGNNRELVEYFFELADDPLAASNVVHGAAAGRHRAVMNEYIEIAGDNLNEDWGFYGACFGGDIDIMRYFIEELGAGRDDSELREGIYYAGEGGHMSAVEFLASMGAEWNHAFEGAANAGHVELMKRLLSKFTLDRKTLDSAASFSIYGNQRNALLYLVELGFRDFEKLLHNRSIQKEMKRLLEELIVLRDSGQL